ncbi:MAG: chemotaxis protein CheD [Anaerolineales bacterium]|jgi:chemotaxis protein CheD|nr:chemotaxis protein CheD [Anaerolineales bacterium]
MINSIVVGLGEIKISNSSQDVLVAYGLGSCLGIAMYDPVAQVAGMLHAVLPTCNLPSNNDESCTKYVFCGIEVLLKKIIEAGGQRSRIVVRMAGGANMVTATTLSDIMNIGQRNIDAAHQKLKELNMKVAGEEVGGNIGRTVRFYVSNGRVAVRMMGGKERDV